MIKSRRIKINYILDFIFIIAPTYTQIAYPEKSVNVILVISFELILPLDKKLILGQKL